MSADPLVLFQQDDSGVAVVTLNRPQAMNSLDMATARAFREVFERLATERTARAVVLRGAGKAFSAGGDLALLSTAPESAGELIDHVHEGLKAMASLDAPVIASVHGAAAGAGMSLCAACDLALAAEGTRFNLAFASVGATCDSSSTWSLPRLLGLRRALEIALLCETLDADQALRIGLVNRVVPADQLEAETMRLAQRLAGGATLAYGRIKRLMRQSFETTFAEQLDAERDAFQASAQTDDFRAGTSAFLGKRKPVFNAS